MRVVFIDVETTGLDHNKHSIWQIAYVLAEQEQKTLKLFKAKEMLVLPFLPFMKTFVKFFIKKEIEQVNLIVAHNVKFERAFLYSNYNLYIPSSKLYCTMLKSKYLCDIKYYAKDFVFTKYPKLAEAVEILLKEKVEEKQLHDALYDVFLVVKLYAYIEKLKIDTSNLKIYRQPYLFKRFFRFLFSPFEKEARQEIKDKLLSPFTTVKLTFKSLKFKLDRLKRKKEDFPLTFEE